MKFKIKYLVSFILVSFLMELNFQFNLNAQTIQSSDTLYLDCNHTLHLIFDKDVAYMDLSCPDEVAVKITSPRNNILAVRAKEPFQGQRNLSVLLSNDKFFPLVVKFETDISYVVKDYRTSKDYRQQSPSDSVIHPSSDTLSISKEITHLGITKQKLSLLCTKISMAESGRTTIGLSMVNNSTEPFQMGRIQTMIRRNRKVSNSLSYDSELIPIEIQGSLSCFQKQESTLVMTFEKIILRKDEYLEITAFEKASQRVLTLRIDQAELDRQRD